MQPSLCPCLLLPELIMLLFQEQESLLQQVALLLCPHKLLIQPSALFSQ